MDLVDLLVEVPKVLVRERERIYHGRDLKVVERL